MGFNLGWENWDGKDLKLLKNKNKNCISFCIFCGCYFKIKLRNFQLQNHYLTWVYKWTRFLSKYFLSTYFPGCLSNPFICCYPLVWLITPEGHFIGWSSHSWDFSCTPCQSLHFSAPPFIVKCIQLWSFNIFFSSVQPISRICLAVFYFDTVTERSTVWASPRPSSTRQMVFLCFMLQCGDHYRPDVNAALWIYKEQRIKGITT